MSPFRTHCFVPLKCWFCPQVPKTIVQLSRYFHEQKIWGDTAVSSLFSWRELVFFFLFFFFSFFFLFCYVLFCGNSLVVTDLCLCWLRPRYARMRSQNRHFTEVAMQSCQRPTSGTVVSGDIDITELYCTWFHSAETLVQSGWISREKELKAYWFDTKTALDWQEDSSSLASVVNRSGSRRIHPITWSSDLKTNTKSAT